MVGSPWGLGAGGRANLTARGGQGAERVMAAPDFGSFSTAEKQALLTAAKAELLRRTGIGSVQTGSSTGQSFGMQKVPHSELVAMIDALTVELGYPQPIVQASPNFAGRAGYAWPQN